MDPALASPDGSCISVESYLHKGRLTIANRCKRKDVPGVWVAGKYHFCTCAPRANPLYR